ncbi:hypothetical protein BOTCAL_0200g00010 [Botryotinia calthae]|uniref:Uncharacterized protein n=1 Tax=Botryotinia calthae TaxID=38488 RepID=A0A4Y8CZA4_9HELO|nr:hypothetical protein BOTCAL_0200g00010 [Botryotinia calthae]
MWTSLNAAGQSLSTARQYAKFFSWATEQDPCPAGCPPSRSSWNNQITWIPMSIIPVMSPSWQEFAPWQPIDRRGFYDCQHSLVRIQLMPAEFGMGSELSPGKEGHLIEAAHVMRVLVSYSEAQAKNGYCGVEPLGWHIFDTSATDNQILGNAKTRRSVLFASNQLHDNNQL